MIIRDYDKLVLSHFYIHIPTGVLVADLQNNNRQRLDKWLWHARMARTRTQAAKLVVDGYIRLHGRRIVDPAKNVRANDILTFALPHRTLVIKIAGFSEGRGSAPEAQKLYSVIDTTDKPAAEASAEAAMQKSMTINDDTTLASDDECH